MCGRGRRWIWRRGCAGRSVYFPDRAIPMLPPQLSSGMCSLRPDEDRLVLSCVMEIDGRGEVLGYEVCEGIIRSARRMTYTQVQACDSDGRCGDAARSLRSWCRSLSGCRAGAEAECEAAAARVDRFRSAGAGDSSSIRMGTWRRLCGRERGWSHRLIEEFMLSANECVATWIEEQGDAEYLSHSRDAGPEADCGF